MAFWSKQPPGPQDVQPFGQLTPPKLLPTPWFPASQDAQPAPPQVLQPEELAMAGYWAGGELNQEDSETAGCLLGVGADEFTLSSKGIGSCFPFAKGLPWGAEKGVASIVFPGKAGSTTLSKSWRTGTAAAMALVVVEALIGEFETNPAELLIPD